MSTASRSDAPAEPLAVHDTQPPPPVTRTSRIVGIVFTLVSIALIIYGVTSRFAREKAAATERGRELSARREAANLPPEVGLSTPEPFAYNPHFSITGTLDPVQQAELGFNVAGRLASVTVALGQQVQAGDVLATLDRRSVAAQSALAGASVQAGDVQVQMAQDRLRRAEALHQRGATSDQELEAARQAVALATAQLSQAQAQTRVVSTQGSDHLLRAPFAGTITRVPDGVGNVIMPGTGLFRLEDMSALVLRSGITERALARIQVGDAVSLELFPDLRGQVRAFARSLDPVTRRAPVEIAFTNPNGALVGHQLVKGAILSERAIPTMRIPATAIRADQTVLVVDGQNRIASRQIESIVESDGSGIVLFGLTERDRVVTRPTPDLAVGMTVRPAAPAAPAQTAGR